MDRSALHSRTAPFCRLTVCAVGRDSSPDVHDVVVVGAGILGLATARALLRRHPSLRLLVVDKEPLVASHQTGHNSGVLHAGLYYTPGSLKARLCRSGKSMLEEYAEQRGIPVQRCGKLVIATGSTELPALDELHRRGEANGVPDLQMLGPAGLRDVEPHATGIRALWSPSTAIVDYRTVAAAMVDDIRAAGGQIRLSTEITAVTKSSGQLLLESASETLAARNMVACAGLQADRVSQMTGSPSLETMVPFRGSYYLLSPSTRSLVRGLIYPVPDPQFPFLGIHLTRRIDGEVLAGPNAVLAYRREGYRRRDVRLEELRSVLADPGFRLLARRHWRTGLAETWRDWDKSAFTRAVRRFVPELRSRDLRHGPAGVRAQAVDPDGSLVDDFRLGSEERILHVRNAPSPAATASMAIAEHLVSKAELQFADLP
ncbi:MAG: L-2-hydroxyglutarate oxidase [Acidimicrobiales bacterium]|nr:L-2-hydroxyglutarate oxidase [Acidimicrobiales bacterium]